MKWFRNRAIRYGILVSIIAAGALALRAALPGWAQETIAFTPLEAALFRIMGLPDGSVTHVRPAWESRDHLSQLIAKTPGDAELYGLRARQQERLADYAAAEADWKRAAAESQNKIAALEQLADFYHRRVRSELEVSALLQLAALPYTADERFQAATQQKQWNAFSRAIQVCDESLLPPTRYQQVYAAWIHRYPRESAPYQAYLEYAIKTRNRASAQSIAARLKAAFPGDTYLAVTTDANLARVETGSEAALAVYSRNFSALWPDPLRASYFQELTAAHQLRTFLAEAQSAATADPTNVDPASRIFFYYEQEGRKPVAEEALLTLVSARAARQSLWTSQDLSTVAALLLRVGDYDESAKLDYSLYKLPSATSAEKQAALSHIVSLLLDVPEQPLNFGNRDLSLYRNISRMDRHPGFLNGILSLVLNDTNPEFQYQNASQAAVPYFHRASASRLIDLFRQQFPRATELPELEAKLFAAYAAYGQEEAIVRDVPGWLNRNPNAPEHLSTALLLADAYESKNNTQAELALYDRLLTEFAARSGHMPIGPAGVIANAGRVDGVPGTIEPPAPTGTGRSPDYSRVLDRYISRLVELNRVLDALALFRKEIDHNPDDPGIYERFALFLEQNRLDADLERTYRDALNHFKDMSWASKLGRFYLREKEEEAYAELAHRITDAFKGSDLAQFFANAGTGSPTLFRQVNLYAHKRFPYNLVFVRNLLEAYRSPRTRDESAYLALLRENWFYDADLQSAYFGYLSSTGKLRTELASLPDLELSVKDSNLAALEFRSGAEAWLTHYEAAGPAFVRLASLLPGDHSYLTHAVTVERSLGASNQGAFASAVRLAEESFTNDPGNLTTVTRVGEIYADREMYAQARTWWNRAAAVRPGESAGYLDSATVFWDYFQFKDSLRVISESRRRLGKPALFAYEAGAIYENEGDPKQAIDSYISAVLHDGSEQARVRLLTLAGRKRTAGLVEQATSRLTAGTFDNGAFQLRLALLEKSGRRSDLQAMLSSLLPRANNLAEVEEISRAATRLGFDDVAADSLARLVSMTSDPIEKIQARIELARFYEARNKMTEADTQYSSLLKDERNRLGVLRAAVDFYWRQKKSAKAITTLADAASRAQEPYIQQLRREAAEKAADSGQYEEARRLIDQLLAKDAYNGDLLAEKASTFARQDDIAGLMSFYSAELKSLETSSLPSQQKTDRIAALRRGYVLALATAGHFRDALEQYELLLNAYPEDASLASEVARYAENHGFAAAVIAYYTKATADSPHDYRWPLVLARIQTALRHYPEAIAAFEKAAYVRPDRSDLFVAKAELETRLLRFNDALKSYRKLYDLSFHNSEYLADQAELFARMDNKPEAVHLLRGAYIDPHPRELAGYITAMQKLSDWRMFVEETQLFKELRPLLSQSSPWRQTALALQCQALVALHRPNDALAIIAGADSAPGQAALASALGTAIATYLEPNERAAVADRVQHATSLPSGFDRYTFAQAADLREFEASELARPSMEGVRLWPRLNELQSSRLLFEDLGHQLEALAETAPVTSSRGIMAAAFAAYKNAGDTASQLRLASYSGAEFPRLFVVAGGDVNQRLTRLATTNPRVADQVLQYIVFTQSPEQAVSAIAARGTRLGPLWTQSYTSLEALYSLSTAPWSTAAFEQVLGPRTVQAQLRSTNDVLRDRNWFYYAARFGDYLGYLKRPNANDYLPASLEGSPAASNSYVQLADTLTDLKQPARAERLYRDGLQLSPDRADIYSRLGQLAMARNQRSEAIGDWRRGFELLAGRVEKGSLPPDYWSTARDLLANANAARAINELKPSADAMLRTYARRNGAYQFDPFLAGIFDHAPDKRAALAWVSDLARIPALSGILSEVIDSSAWVDPADKDSLYRDQIERARKTSDEARGEAVIQARAEVNRQLTRYAQHLSAQSRWNDEWAVIQEIQPASEIPPDLLLSAGALSGHLNSLLQDFRGKPGTAPQGEQVLNVAASLQKSGHADFALQLKEYEYERELAGNGASASSWFGLADVRLAQKRNDEALALIRDVTLTVGAPFENLPEAVHFLGERGLSSEARKYTLEWKAAEPWNETAQVAYARLASDRNLLEKVRHSPTVPYNIRVEAARAMRSLSFSVSGTDELAVLTRKAISPSEASQPFYVEARLDAAKQSSDAAIQMKLYLEAIAIHPSLHEPRLDLAQAAFESRHDALGLAAFESYRAPGTEYNGGNEARVDDSAKPSYTVVMRLAADVQARRQNWSEALAFYDELLRSELDAALRSSVQKQRDAAAYKQSLQTANEARCPIVTEDVAQPIVVKPKLSVLPPNFSIPKPANGEVQ